MSISWIIVIILAAIALGLGITILIMNGRRKSNSSDRGLGNDLADSRTELEDLKKQLTDLQEALTTQQYNLDAKQSELVKKMDDERSKTLALDDCVAREKQLNEKLQELTTENATLVQSNRELSKQARRVREISDALRAYIRALDNARKEIEDLKKRSVSAEQRPTIEDVIKEINQAVVHSWDASVSTYLRQNYETVAEAISNGRLAAEIDTHELSSDRRSRIIDKIKNTLIEPIEKLK